MYDSVYARVTNPEHRLTAVYDLTRQTINGGLPSQKCAQIALVSSHVEHIAGIHKKKEHL
jgi:hypothetical protein